MNDTDQGFINPHMDPVLSRYLKSVREWHGYIRFLGLPHLRENPDVVIDRLFVEPRLATSYISPETAPETWPPTTNLLETIATEHRLVLLGDPGSGKSTLVSWLAWQFAQTRETACTNRLGCLVPLPLILRELDIRTDLTWNGLMESFLAHAMSESLRGGDDLEELLARGQGLLMLDGLDEIGDPGVRAGLRRAVHAGMDRYPRCHWLLTSRIVGYEEVPFDENDSAETPHPDLIHGIDAGGESGSNAPTGPLTGSDFSSVSVESMSVPQRLGPQALLANLAPATRGYVAPFKDAQIERFARNWYEIREPVKSRAAEGARDLTEAIRADTTTQRLARIPNLLTMMALIHRVRARLPDGRALLYGEIAQAYLQSIDEFRGIAQTNYSLAQKRRWLARVGFEMQRRRMGGADSRPETGNVILAAADQVREWVVASMADSGLGRDRDAADDFIRFIGRRSGLLLPRGPGVFAFLHLSIQEYFAALFLMEQVMSPRWIRQGIAVEGAARGDLRGYARQSVWQETLLFLFELLADQPGWPETLVQELFGADLKDIDSVVSGPTRSPTFLKFFGADPNESDREHPDVQTAAVLLARIAVDPHTGLPEPLRHHAIESCLSREVANQKRLKDDSDFVNYQPEIARWIFSAEAYQPFAWERLVASAKHVWLTQLSLAACVRIDDISALQSLPPLRRLSLIATRVTDLTQIQQRLNQLDLLVLSGTSVRNVAPIRGLDRLKYLSIEGPVADLSLLRDLRGLQTLILVGCKVRDLRYLRGLPNLGVLILDIEDGPDLSPLRGLSNLHLLVLGGDRVNDLKALYGLDRLAAVSLSLSMHVPAEQIEELKKQRPGVVISRH